MTLNELKSQLNGMKTIAFELPDGSLVPSHFHVTEVGKVTKDFIDCGGKRRFEEVANLQLWDSVDYDHRLHPEKLVHIIDLSQKTLEMGDLQIEVEYQGETISKFGLDVKGSNFLLTQKQTDCLAKENCGVPELSNSGLPIANSTCTPGGGCC